MVRVIGKAVIWTAILGWWDFPTDGVEDSSTLLCRAFSRPEVALKLTQVDSDTLGRLRAAANYFSKDKIAERFAAGISHE
jgi:hypothetical protein